MEEKFYTPAEAARRYRVTARTVHRWIHNGRLAAIDVGGAPGPYLIREEHLKEFEERQLRAVSGGVHQ